MKTRWSGAARALPLVDRLCCSRASRRSARASPSRAPSGASFSLALRASASAARYPARSRPSTRRRRRAEERRVHLRPEQLARVRVEGVVEGVGKARPSPSALLSAGARGPLCRIASKFSVPGSTCPRRRSSAARARRGCCGSTRRDRESAPDRTRASPRRPPASRTSPARWCRRGLAACGSRRRRRGSPVRLVALPALPEAERPARHHRRLAGHRAVAGDDLVQLRAVDEVVVDAVADLRPERGGRRGGGVFHKELHRLHALVLGPLELDAMALAGLETRPGDVVPRQPALAPVVDDQSSSIHILMPALENVLNR